MSKTSTYFNHSSSVPISLANEENTHKQFLSVCILSANCFKAFEGARVNLHLNNYPCSVRA